MEPSVLGQREDSLVWLLEQWPWCLGNHGSKHLQCLFLAKDPLMYAPPARLVILGSPCLVHKNQCADKNEKSYEISHLASLRRAVLRGSMAAASLRRAPPTR